MHTTRASLIVLALAAPAAALIPPHPDQIEFPPLSFEPPSAESYRYTIETTAGTVPVYLAPSAEFPLITVSFTFRGGADHDPAGRPGLVSAMTTMMRRGGTRSMTPDRMDEELDFLAAVVSSGSGENESTATLNCLASNFDESFALFMDMIRNAAFDADRLDLYKQEVLESLKQRNDFPQSILGREWGYLVYGEDHFEAAQPTAAAVESVTPGDLGEMHDRIIHPGNLIVAATGDFEPETMLAKLEAALDSWPAGPPAGRPQAPAHEMVPGLYHVEKDIPQGHVTLGLRSISRDDPDYFPLVLMNRILGGGGFTSRIVQRVRSDEGLAYSARSGLTTDVEYPGQWQASFQSKSRTVALALRILFEEIERIREEPVTDEELELARNALIETFPQRFESKSGMLRTFVNDEMTDRPDGYWERYRDRVRAVTPDDIRRVARKYLRPEDMAILVVGRWDDIAPGDLEGRADMSGWTVNRLPLRDPLTLVPME